MILWRWEKRSKYMCVGSLTCFFISFFQIYPSSIGSWQYMGLNENYDYLLVCSKARQNKKSDLKIQRRKYFVLAPTTVAWKWKQARLISRCLIPFNCIRGSSIWFTMSKITKSFFAQLAAAKFAFSRNAFRKIWQFLIRNFKSGFGSKIILY